MALIHLVARLRAGGFVLLDAQFLTEHLAPFGAERDLRAPNIAERLAAALAAQAPTSAGSTAYAGGEAAMQAISQAS